MDVPQLKNITQKLKDYSSLLVPAVLVLIAVGLFIPAQLMSSNLKERMLKESVRQGGKKIKSLMANVPAAEQWKEEQKYQLAFETDANEVARLAEQSSRRQLLSYKIFPQPDETSKLIFTEFGRQFRAGIDSLLEGINFIGCPTERELERSLQKSPTRRSRRGYGYMPGPISGAGTRSLLRRLSEVDETILEQLCREKAESATVYADPAVISGYEFWEKYDYSARDKAVEDCWYWQIGYWIIEDVIDTIGVINKDSGSILSSPVKRLLRINFNPESSRMSRTRRGRGGRGSARARRTTTDHRRPVYVFDDGRTVSLTGRFTTDDNSSGGQKNAGIDVVHFELVVAVGTKAVGFSGKDSEQTFRHNQITVLGSNINPINREDEQHRLYCYGEEDAVVELNLICEYIFNKAGYDEIKPDSVKKSTD